MGEAKRKKAMGLRTIPRDQSTDGGHHRPGGVSKRVPIVRNIKLENSGEHVLMMLGNTEPMLGVAMGANEARQLAKALEQHADRIEPERRIILPG